MADATRVFLSYSRRDRAYVDALQRGLEARGFEILRDVDDILPAEEWRRRLEQLITGADGIAFVLTPASVASEVCAWEVARAVGLGKRLVPVLAVDLDPATVPAELAERNWLRLEDPEGDDLDALARALETDVAWVREHTRLVELAVAWQQGAAGADALLRGRPLRAAEEWLAARRDGAPQVPQVLYSYLAEGRRRASRVRAGLLAGAVVVAVGALALAGLAEVNRRRAVSAQETAESATREAQRQETQALVSLSDAQRAAGETPAALASALQAAAIVVEDGADVERALYESLWAPRLTARTQLDEVGDLRADARGVTVHGEDWQLAFDPGLVARSERPPGAPPRDEGPVTCGDREVRAGWYGSASLVSRHADPRQEEGIRVAGYVANLDYASRLTQHVAFAPGCETLLRSGAHNLAPWQQPTLITASVDVYGGEVLARLGGHADPVGALAAGPAGRWYTLDAGGALRAWDLAPSPDPKRLAAHRGAALRPAPTEVEDPENTDLGEFGKASCLQRAPGGQLAALGTKYGQVVINDGGAGRLLTTIDEPITAIARDGEQVWFVAGARLGRVSAQGGAPSWGALPESFANCWSPIIDPGLGVVYCAGGDGIPTLHRLEDPARTLELLPEAVREVVDGLGNVLQVAPHPGCRRALVRYAGTNVDQPYEGGAAYVDLETWRIVAPAPAGRSLEAFCSLDDLVEYASAL